MRDKSMIKPVIVALAFLVAASSTATAKEATVMIGGREMTVAQLLQRQLAGEPFLDKPALDAALAEASKHPLGSEKNPVRAESPIGQRAYLKRLRCADGHAPYFSRIGNLGPGVFASVIDDYVVDCGASAPGQVHVIMDMYFKGYIEQQPVPGFTLVPTEAPAPVPAG